jgi:hypothetical protein
LLAALLLAGCGDGTPSVSVSDQGLRKTGHACNSDADCASGSCLGGHCCASGCTVGSACGATACLKNSGACVYPSSSTACRTASCANGVATAAATCTGSGTCPAPVTTSCAPYACDASACKTTCSTDADCSSGTYCNGTSCALKAPRIPRPGCDQFPELIALDKTVSTCAQNCCGGQDKCYFDNDCLNAGAGSAACQKCDQMITQCIGICRLGALECNNMICGCAQSRCYDFACGDGQAGYCAPNCAIVSASPCGPQHPGEIMSGGSAQVLNAGYNMNMGFKFTPTAPATATRLGGLYNGTMIVRLYADPTSLFGGTVIAQATHTSANAFSYTPIAPVQLAAGTLYAVAVDVSGNASAYTALGQPDDTRYGKTIVNCPAYGLAGGTPYACSSPYYYGMADVELTY